MARSVPDGAVYYYHVMGQVAPSFSGGRLLRNVALCVCSVRVCRYLCKIDCTNPRCMCKIVARHYAIRASAVDDGQADQCNCFINLSAVCGKAPPYSEAHRRTTWC